MAPFVNGAAVRYRVKTIGYPIGFADLRAAYSVVGKVKQVFYLNDPFKGLCFTL